MVFQFEHICLQYQEGQPKWHYQKRVKCREVERNLQQMADRVKC